MSGRYSWVWIPARSLTSYEYLSMRKPQFLHLPKGPIASTHRHDDKNVECLDEHFSVWNGENSQ